MDKNLTIEDALKMEKPTDNFIITLADNTPGVRFNGFKLRDLGTGEVYHEYYPHDIYELDYFADHELEYEFQNKIIRTKTIGTTLQLVVVFSGMCVCPCASTVPIPSGGRLYSFHLWPWVRKKVSAPASTTA